MKVVIVGGGLSGLSAALAIRRHVKNESNGQCLEVKVYEVPETVEEPRSGAERMIRRKLGAGLGLQSNGLRVLDALDPNLSGKVRASGFPCDHFKWKTSGNILLAREYVDVLPISRPLLIDCLEESLPAGVFEYKRVSKVIVCEGQKPVVQFEDGSPDEMADLVIGADGIRSRVRQALFTDAEKYGPQYLGICGVGGILDMALPQHLIDDPSMVFLMGSTGVFGYTGLTQSDKNKILYWSMYSTPLPDRDMRYDHDKLLRELRERHQDWADPLIAKCLQKSELDNVYPVFVMPDLPRWGRDGCVLIGDAAHALPPRSGQGASQALEDGLALALLLAARVDSHGITDGVALSINDLYHVRHARVDSIRTEAMAWKDPAIPMPWWKTLALFVFVSLYAKWQNLNRSLRRGDPWDLQDEVVGYLNGGSKF